MALGDIDVHSAWPAWHLWQVWHFPTSRHRLSLCVAGMALGDIDRHFAWQACHLWNWAGSGGALGFQFAISIVYAVFAVLGS